VQHLDLQKIRRTSDLMCSMHSRLRDIYARRALALDLLILILTLWLTCLAFADPTIEELVTPFDLRPKLWAGIVAAIAFALAIVQLKVDLKTWADNHNRAASAFADLKLEVSKLSSSANKEQPKEVLEALQSRYMAISQSHVPIPERWFLHLKQYHYRKVVISRLIEINSTAPLFWLRLRSVFAKEANKNGTEK
jgi:hypothetical protein